MRSVIWCYINKHKHTACKVNTHLFIVIDFPHTEQANNDKTMVQHEESSSRSRTRFSVNGHLPHANRALRRQQTQKKTEAVLSMKELVDWLACNADFNPTENLSDQIDHMSD